MVLIQVNINWYFTVFRLGNVLEMGDLSQPNTGTFLGHTKQDGVEGHLRLKKQSLRPPGFSQPLQ